jgi:hypothetical protein
MIPSLNEVEAIAYKATRGAGWPWGLAEEAARASRWLARHGLPWEWLAHLLEQGEPVPPVLELRRLRPGGPGGLCPLRAGALVAESGRALLPLHLEFVKVPLLLLPFVAERARRTGRRIVMRWSHGSFACAPDGTVAGSLDLHGWREGLLDNAEIREEAEPGLLSPTRLLPQSNERRLPDIEALVTLQRLVQRTYVPASERSRRHGAGAGLLDAD